MHKTARFDVKNGGCSRLFLNLENLVQQAYIPSKTRVNLGNICPPVVDEYYHMLISIRWEVLPNSTTAGGTVCLFNLGDFSEPIGSAEFPNLPGKKLANSPCSKARWERRRVSAMLRCELSELTRPFVISCPRASLVGHDFGL